MKGESNALRNETPSRDGRHFCGSSFGSAPSKDHADWQIALDTHTHIYIYINIYIYIYTIYITSIINNKPLSTDDGL